MALVMIHGAGLDRCYWAMVIHATTYIRNRAWSDGADGVLYQFVTGLPPDLNYLRVFGCLAMFISTSSYVASLTIELGNECLWATRWTLQYI